MSSLQIVKRNSKVSNKIDRKCVIMEDKYGVNKVIAIILQRFNSVFFLKFLLFDQKFVRGCQNSHFS